MVQKLWEALSNGDIAQAVKLYNTAIAGMPYDDFPNRNDWYCSLFIMLLKGAGIVSYAEVHIFRGQSDLLLQFNNITIVLEFKFSQKSLQVANMMKEGIFQVRSREYAKSYTLYNRKIVMSVLVVDDEKRQIVFD